MLIYSLSLITDCAGGFVYDASNATPYPIDKEENGVHLKRSFSLIDFIKYS
jgi:hypothetical protein